MDKTSWRSTNNLFDNHTTEEFSVFDEKIFIFWAIPVILTSLDFEIDWWNDKRKKLFTCPERSRLKNSRWRQFTFQLAIDIKPHKKIHHLVKLNKSVSLSEQHDSEQGILYNTHDRLVILWGDYLFWDCHDLFDLSFCLVALWDVHIHLITIKISIVRRCNT